MPKKQNEPIAEDWISNAFKGAIFCLFTVFAFLGNQLNGNIASLTSQLRSMESHQVETDKRVLAIEVSREVNMEAYKKVVSDVSKSVEDIAEIKAQVGTLSMRVQTIADFVAKRAK